ncbi:MAG: DMT family transporter [Alphaproteobacteria bacterium]|nr:DMT family transporter [Alphaproteobacteria bacterium]
MINSILTEAPARRNLTAAAHLMASLFLFAIMDALIKWLSADYPVHQIVFFRSAFALIPSMLLAYYSGGLSTLRTRRPGAHFLRGLVGILSMGLIFHAYSVMKLADAAAILFAGPLFLTALAGPALGEKVGIRRWSAVAIGFAGVLVIIQPGGTAMQPAAFGALAAAGMYALAMVLVSKLGTTESSASITFYFSLFGTVTGVVLLILFGWTETTPRDFLMLATVGIIGGVAQLFMTKAFRLGEATVISPLKYSSMIWVVLFGYVIWGDLPALHVVIGVAIVIASGLYIVHREAVLAIARRRLLPIR